MSFTVSNPSTTTPHTHGTAEGHDRGRIYSNDHHLPHLRSSPSPVHPDAIALICSPTAFHDTPVLSSILITTPPHMVATRTFRDPWHRGPRWRHPSSACLPGAFCGRPLVCTKGRCTTSTAFTKRRTAAGTGRRRWRCERSAFGRRTRLGRYGIPLSRTLFFLHAWGVIFFSRMYRLVGQKLIAGTMTLILRAIFLGGGLS